MSVRPRNEKKRRKKSQVREKKERRKEKERCGCSIRFLHLVAWVLLTLINTLLTLTNWCSFYCVYAFLFSPSLCLSQCSVYLLRVHSMPSSFLPVHSFTFFLSLSRSLLETFTLRSLYFFLPLSRSPALFPKRATCCWNKEQEHAEEKKRK